MKNLNLLLFFTVLLACNTVENKENLTDSSTSRPSVIDSIYKVEHFVPAQNYEPISLQYKGKSLLKPGQHTNQLDSVFSFRSDPNLEYNYLFSDIVDYLSTDNFFWIKLPTGSVNGIFYFSATRQEHQIFNISGYWLFDIDIMKESEKKAALDSLSTKLFPILRDKIQWDSTWQFTLQKEQYTEVFKMNAPENGGHWWTLSYEVKMSDY